MLAGLASRHRTKVFPQMPDGLLGFLFQQLVEIKTSPAEMSLKKKLSLSKSNAILKISIKNGSE